MKKLIIALIMVVLFVPLFVVPAFAYPPKYGLIKANKRKHIVRNYLYDSAGDVSGWVTFACQSVEGFQYSIAVRGLSPRTTYTVRAESLPTAYLPPPVNATLPTSDGPGNTYSLGTIKTNGEGEGEVTGLIPLSSWHPFLPFGLYNWEIRVADPIGTDVLWTIPADPIDFVVFPAWP